MMKKNKFTVIHIITGLNNGGAEAVLFRLINQTQSNISHFVISLLDEGKYGNKLKKINVPVEALNLSKINFIPKFYILVRLLKRINPDIIQTWMYHADLFGGIAGKFIWSFPVVWGIRHSNLDKKNNKSLTLIIAKILAAVSSFIPDAIISCSKNAAQIHQVLGYNKEKFYVIPNGYDLFSFKPNTQVRHILRQSWKINNSEFLIGLVGRWNAQKDHHNLIQAISILKQKNYLVRCIFVGHGICKENYELVGLIEKYNLKDQITLLGPRNDIPDVMNALDLHVLPSAFGEAFPNVVAEAMACGTPCVVTDVGDADYIVGDIGWVVPPKDPLKLANAIENAALKIKELSRKNLGSKCRKRIQNNFSIDKVANAYIAAWKQVIASKGT